MSFYDFYSEIVGSGDNLIFSIFACSSALIFLEAFFKSLFSAIFSLFSSRKK